jgi:predicted DNA-binding ribbon-helix-helix protein
VALEDAFWDALHDIALATGKRRAYLITQVSKQPRPTNLSSALRLFVLDYYRRQHEQVQEMEVRTSTRPARR